MTKQDSRGGYDSTRQTDAARAANLAAYASIETLDDRFGEAREIAEHGRNWATFNLPMIYTVGGLARVEAVQSPARFGLFVGRQIGTSEPVHSPSKLDGK